MLNCIIDQAIREVGQCHPCALTLFGSASNADDADCLSHSLARGTET